jgi:hypothetical protein
VARKDKFGQEKGKVFCCILFINEGKQDREKRDRMSRAGRITEIIELIGSPRFTFVCFV